MPAARQSMDKGPAGPSELAQHRCSGRVAILGRHAAESWRCGAGRGISNSAATCLLRLLCAMPWAWCRPPWSSTARVAVPRQRLNRAAPASASAGSFQRTGGRRPHAGRHAPVRRQPLVPSSTQPATSNRWSYSMPLCLPQEKCRILALYLSSRAVGLAL